ncbi:MAG: alpha/beta hydrolase family protein [Steroidobacterales bacterium]
MAAMLAACGSDSPTAVPAPSTAPGTLAVSPPLRIASADAATFQAQLSASTLGSELLQIVGPPTCGIDFYYIKFWTTGAAGETTESSGALMVPTGAAPACSGPRPIVLYAHATQFEKSFNIADPTAFTTTPNNDGPVVAATFAAQGYIVIAPNFAGYDISTLGYHPFLNATQQSGEMIDALTAGRAALPTTFTPSTGDNGQLFISGYSAGGYVAMATQRALEAAGKSVTAAAPMSGPYALEALFDAVVTGDVDLGSTLFTPLVTSSYQHAYGNLYTTPTDFYSATYATGIDRLMPTTVTPYTALFTQGLLPEFSLFDSTTPVVTVPNDPTLSTQLTDLLAVPAINPANLLTELFAEGFGNPYLINNSVRVNYTLDAAANPDGTATGSASLAAVAPTYPLRLGLYKNDMRNGSWAPNSPTLMCGGEKDPTVFFSADTLTMAAFWSTLPAGLVTALDVDPAGGPSGPYAPIQAAFQASQAQELAQLQTAPGGALSLAAAEQVLIGNYHGASVIPFCSLAARIFFSNF